MKGMKSMEEMAQKLHRRVHPFGERDQTTSEHGPHYFFFMLFMPFMVV